MLLLQHKSIQAALKLFIAKPLTQMLYGAQLGPFLHYKSFEAIEAIFFQQTLFQDPGEVVNVMVRREAGQQKDESMVINSYLLTQMPLFPSLWTPLVLTDQLESSQQQATFRPTSSFHDFYKVLKGSSTIAKQTAVTNFASKFDHVNIFQFKYLLTRFMFELHRSMNQKLRLF